MNHNELIKHREGLGLTQDEMAAKLGTSVHTYRKWEQKQRKVPSWVDKDLAPKTLELGPLTIEEMEAVHTMAKRNGITFKAQVAELVRQGIKAALAIILLGVIGYQVSHPSDLQARRVGRRKDGIGALEIMGEA